MAGIPAAEVSRVALGFPGTLGHRGHPGAGNRVVPSQADDLEGDGTPDEFVFPVELAPPRNASGVHVYYSTTLRGRHPMAAARLG